MAGNAKKDTFFEKKEAIISGHFDFLGIAFAGGSTSPNRAKRNMFCLG